MSTSRIKQQTQVTPLNTDGTYYNLAKKILSDLNRSQVQAYFIRLTNLIEQEIAISLRVIDDKILAEDVNDAFTSAENQQNAVLDKINHIEKEIKFWQGFENFLKDDYTKFYLEPTEINQVKLIADNIQGMLSLYLQRVRANDSLARPFCPVLPEYRDPNKVYVINDRLPPLPAMAASRAVNAGVLITVGVCVFAASVALTLVSMGLLTGLGLGGATLGLGLIGAGFKLGMFDESKQKCLALSPAAANRRISN